MVPLSLGHSALNTRPLLKKDLGSFTDWNVRQSQLRSDELPRQLTGSGRGFGKNLFRYLVIFRPPVSQEFGYVVLNNVPNIHNFGVIRDRIMDPKTYPSSWWQLHNV